MTYTYHREVQDQVDFRVSRYEQLLPLALLILGIPGLILGFYGIISGFLWSGIGTFDYLLAAVGGIFFSAGMLLSNNKRREPRCIRFDNGKAQLVISQDHHFSDTVSIPFQDLKGFSHRRKSDSSVSGPTTQATYEVFLISKDHQIWVLGEFRTEAKAVEQLHFLNDKITLEKVGTEVAPTTPKSITVQRVGSSTILKWKNASDSNAFFGLAILISIYFIGVFIFEKGAIPVLFYYIFLTVLSLSIVSLLFNYLKKRNRLVRLEISNSKLIYGSEKQSEVTTIRELELHQIRAVGTNFSGQESGKGLLISDTETFQLMDEVQNRRLAFRDALRALQQLRRAFQIDVSGLSGVDAFRLSIMIRALAQARTGNIEKEA